MTTQIKKAPIIIGLLFGFYTAAITPLAFHEIDDRLRAYYGQQEIMQVAEALPAYLEVPLPPRKGGI